MAKLEWPPENTFKYVFNNVLDMEIPAINTESKKDEVNRNEEER